MTNWRSMIRTADLEQLEANWTKQQPLKGTRNEQDFEPVVKLFDPMGAATWLITELEPDSSLAFGLCDLGFGTPELGYLCLEEVASIQIRGCRRIEQDVHFTARKTLSQYADAARKAGCILD